MIDEMVDVEDVFVKLVDETGNFRWSFSIDLDVDAVVMIVGTDDVEVAVLEVVDESRDDVADDFDKDAICFCADVAFDSFVHRVEDFLRIAPLTVFLIPIRLAFFFRERGSVELRAL